MRQIWKQMCQDKLFLLTVVACPSFFFSSHLFVNYIFLKYCIFFYKQDLYFSEFDIFGKTFVIKRYFRPEYIPKNVKKTKIFFIDEYKIFKQTLQELSKDIYNFSNILIILQDCDYLFNYFLIFSLGLIFSHICHFNSTLVIKSSFKSQKQKG